MGYEPPFDLDPHQAIREPETLPVIMARGMFSVIRQKTKNDPTYDDFISGFNISAWSLVTAGRRSSKKTGKKKTVGGQARMKVIEGRLLLTTVGKKLNEEKRRLPDSELKVKSIIKWAEQLKTSDPDRATMTYEEYKRRG
jgi:hypothetical protein